MSAVWNATDLAPQPRKYCPLLLYILSYSILDVVGLLLYKGDTHTIDLTRP